MSTHAEVKLWGSTIGAVVLEDGAEAAAFEYDRDFVNSGIQVAPLMMPLSTRVYQFPEVASGMFKGLPGLLADSLPDKYGNALINEWLARQGRTPESFNAVERLCYTGTRGMGALEYAPILGPKAQSSSRLQVDELIALAAEILTQRSDLEGSMEADERDATLQQILRVGTSAGGARAKAVIAWNPDTNEIRSGQVAADRGFQHWLLKFDGVKGGGDEQLGDPLGMGRVEYAYSRMARDAGIAMSECRLLEENGRSHFMTKRFDRTGNEKLHVQTLAALAHLDFNPVGQHSYEQIFLVMKQLGLSLDAIEEMFRRMVFNILARNHDDHVKNTAFLMNKSGDWSLAPAYDLTYAYDPAGKFTDRHQMQMNGKRDGFTPDDFTACGRVAGLKQGRAVRLLQEIGAVVRNWSDYAEEVGVDSGLRDGIQAGLRSELIPS